MTDAVSSIAFGIDTKEGLEHLVALRAAFSGLKEEIRELNDLKVNTQSMSGAGAARNELTTLGAELKNAATRISDLESQLKNLGKAQIDSVKAVTDSVKQSVAEQAKAVGDSEKRQAAETEALAKKTTKTIEEEVKKRAALSASARVAGGRIGVSEKLDPHDAETLIIKAMLEQQKKLLQDNAAERARLEEEAQAHHAQLIHAGEINDTVTIQELLHKHEEFQAKKAALEQEANRLHAQIMLEGAANDQAYIESKLAAHEVFQAARKAQELAERDEHAVSLLNMLAEDEAYIQAKVRAHETFQAARKAQELAEREQNAHSLLMEAVDANEYIQRKLQEHEAFQAKREAMNFEEVAQHAQALLLEAADVQEYIQQKLHEHEAFQAKRAEIGFQERAQNAQNLLQETLNEEEYIQNKLRLHEEFQAKKAQIEAAGNALHHQMMFEGMVNDQVAMQNELEAKAALARKQLIQDNTYNTSPLSTRVSVTNRAAGLVQSGNAHVATELYGPAAVAAVSDLARMEAVLAESRKQGSSAASGLNSSSRELLEHNKMVAAGLKDLHSGVKGLAEGLDQLWVSWGSMVPLVAGAAITGAMMKILEVGKDVEYQLQYVIALTKKDPVDLDKFVHITETSMESVKDAAAGVRALAQTGLTAKEALTALPDVLNLATIGSMSVSAAALSASGTMHAFGLSVQEVGHIGDVFSVIASSTNTSVEKLTESMRQASTVGDMFKVTLEETAASLGVLAQRNILGGQAGTSLSTALKNLYEPTEKAKRVLDKLGMDTSDGHGGLKPYTELLGNLRDKLMSINEFDRMQILGTLTDARAAKALSAIISNFGSYKEALEKAQGASGFMIDTTLKLEDTVEGGWRRMGNAIDGSFMKAFEKAEPTIRATQFELAKMAGSDETVGLFTKLALAAANITRALSENIGTILTLAAAYVTLRVIATVSNAFVAYRVNVLRATIATELSTSAIREQGLAAESNSLIVAAVGARMASFANAARGVAMALGPISALLTVAYTAYMIFSAKVEDAENSQIKANNTVNTTISYYQRQIDKLKELNEELRKNSKEGTEAARQTARAILLDQQRVAQQKVTYAELQLLAKPETMGEKMAAARFGQATIKPETTELNNAKAELARVTKSLTDLDTTIAGYEKNKEENTQLQNKASIVNEIKGLIQAAAGGDDTSDHSRNLGTEKSRAYIGPLETLLKQVDSGAVAYSGVADTLKDWHKKVNDSLGKMKIPHNEARAENDAYRAKQIGYDGQVQKIKDDEKSDLNGIKSKVGRGEIGELQAVAQELKVVTEARKADLKVFTDKLHAAAAKENHLADQATITNKTNANDRADVESRNEAQRQIAEIQTKWNEQDLKYTADTLKKKGLLYDAYIFENRAKHEREATGLQATIDDKTLPQDQRDAAKKHLDTITAQYTQGGDNALFDQAKSEFDRLYNEMQEKLAAVAEKSARTNESARSPGFITDITAAGKGDAIRTEDTQAMQTLLDGMAAIAEKNPALKASVAKMGTELVKEANRSRDAWIAAGKSIETSLANSFGKGGKAVGGIVSALIKQRETQKGIDDDLKKQKAKPENSDSLKQIELENQARSESAQLQLSSYADIASSAKGFFDEHSKGYAAMQTAERVFRAFEMAESVRNFLVKSGLLSSFTALFATSKATEVGLTEATVAPTVAAEGVKQGAFSITALAGALALPFPANLPAFAIVAAMLASIGIAVAGGGGGASTGPSLSDERQKYTGTGYTYDKNSKSNPYDWELQKSDSMSKSIDRLKDNSDIALRYSSSQLVALEKINSGIAGMASAAVSSAGLRGTRADEIALGVGSSKSFLAFSSSKTTLNDSGIVFDPSTGSVGSILQNGVKARSYADTTTESKSFWGLSSSSSDHTSYGGLDNDLLSQMNLVVKGLYSTITSAGKFFGKDGGTLQQALQGVTLQSAGLDRISLKGMSSDDVEKTLNAAFSKLGDVMAKSAMPGLDAFEKAGEGYLETMIRVSTGIDSAQYSLKRLGVTMVDYTDVLNKQGDVATEIIRDSVALKEGATGIADIVQNFAGTSADMVDTYTKLMGIRNTMRVTGMSNADVTSSMVNGAGGLDKLTTGMNDFMDNFFTDAEKAAAKVTLLQDEFTKIGVPMPKSRDEFKSIAQSIDRTTEAGQTLYGALISLAGQFNDVADSTGAVSPELAKQKTIISGLIETSRHWLDVMGTAKTLVNDLDDAMAETGKGDRTARISELKDLLNSGVGSFEQQLEIAGQLKDLVLEKYQTEKENAQKLIDFGKDMSKYVNSLKTGDLSPLTVKDKMESAMADYQTALSNTSSTDDKVSQDARDQIQDKASTLLDLAHTYYASSQAYTDIFDTVSTELTKLGADNSNKGVSLESLGKSQLGELQNLRDLAKGIEDAATNEYSSTVNQLATQITLMTSMDGSLSMLTELFASMPAQLAMSLGNKGVGLPDNVSSNNTAQDQIETMYSSILHRKSDAAGLDFWLKDYQAGKVTMDDIRNLMANSEEAKGVQINGSHAKGLDYVPFDGYVAELHRGERVLTATEARRTDKAAISSTGSFSASERDEMAAEIAELRKTVERLVDAQADGTKAIVRALGATSNDNAEKIVKGTKEAMSSSDFDNRNKPVFQ